VGTRADFYVGRGKHAEWLGSIAYDGYPEHPLLVELAQAIDESDFRRRVDERLRARDDGTSPDLGWPWPWEDSRTTDYAYSFHEGAVRISNYGRGWETFGERAARHVDERELDDPKLEFRDMRDRQNVTLGPRSGVLVLVT
jgi:hypothetical protein